MAKRQYLTEKERAWVREHHGQIVPLLFAPCVEHEAARAYYPWLIHVVHGERGFRFCPFHFERGRLMKQSEVSFQGKAISNTISAPEVTE